MTRRLRSGYTTGACAAAAAKAAVLQLLSGAPVARVEIPFPDGSRHGFPVTGSRLRREEKGLVSVGAVIKDAGDDPDVTNGAEIRGEARWLAPTEHPAGIPLTERILLRAGEGVGTVTKPGLTVPPGEPAINPVPRQMIRAAAEEALKEGGGSGPAGERLAITIAVPGGKELARKTLNARLGILGGLSILGTTGIVHPVSAEAWTATIRASLDVAKAAGLSEIVLSTGRTSERAVQGLLGLPEEAYAMMGDYLAFSLEEAARHGFARIHLAAMWAKVMKAAARIPQTHVRHGALEVEQALELLREAGAGPQVMKALAGSNTAREIYERLRTLGQTELIREICRRAQLFARETAGNLPVEVYLVDSGGRVAEHV